MQRAVIWCSFHDLAFGALTSFTISSGNLLYATIGDSCASEGHIFMGTSNNSSLSATRSQKILFPFNIEAILSHKHCTTSRIDTLLILVSTLLRWLCILMLSLHHWDCRVGRTEQSHPIFCEYSAQTWLDLQREGWHWFPRLTEWSHLGAWLNQAAVSNNIRRTSCQNVFFSRRRGGSGDF